MILDTIARSAGKRVEQRKQVKPLEQVMKEAFICREREGIKREDIIGEDGTGGGYSFKAALSKPGVSFICEVKKASPSNDAQYFSNDIEFILVYARDKSVWRPHRLPLNEKQMKYYTNPDNDSRGPWNSATYTCNKSKEQRPSLYYPIPNPYTGEEVWPKETAVWAYSKEQCEEHIKNNMLFWGVDGKAKYPRFKKYLSNHQGVVNRTLWHYDDVNHTQRASAEIKS